MATLGATLDKAFDEAIQKKRVVVSMKKDCKQILPKPKGAN